MAALYVHSSGLGAKQWARTASQLGGHAPDLPGYSSSWPGSADFSWGDDAAALSPLLRPNTDLVGHSYGGFLCLQLARTHPLRSLVVWEPVTLSLIEPRLQRPSLLDPATDDEQWLADFIGFWQGDWHAMPDAARAPFRDNAKKVRAEVAQLMGDETRLDQYAEITCPTLILSGSTSVPEILAACDHLAAALPNCRHERIPGAGHMGPLSHRAALHEQLTAFWAAVGDGTTTDAALPQEDSP
ncbi:MAG: alpha/beta hydrolase [Myxococcales bacterium]|nr:alpha/beta hydrolase [Myxococcales bacterium]